MADGVGGEGVGRPTDRERAGNGRDPGATGGGLVDEAERALQEAGMSAETGPADGPETGHRAVGDDTPGPTRRHISGDALRDEMADTPGE